MSHSSLPQLKENLKKYDYPVNIIINVIKKALEILQNELRKPNKKQADEVLLLICIFNANNLPVYNTIKNSAEVLKRNNVLGFERIKLISSKPQPQDLTKAEFSNEEVDVKKVKIRCANFASRCHY